MKNEIVYSSIYTLMHDSATVNLKASRSQDLNDFIGELIDQIINEINKKGKEYKFKDGTNAIKYSLLDILEDKYKKNLAIEKNYEDHALRLLHAEIEIDKKMPMTIIQKGHLFQIHMADEKHDYIIMCKAEYMEYLDAHTDKKSSGMPIKKKIYKSAVFVYSTQELYGSGKAKLTLADVSKAKIKVFDTNSTVSKYWSEKFLELEEIFSAKHNTENSMDLIDKHVLSQIKTKHPADHGILRNSFVKYFRTKDYFDLTDFIEYLFDNYHPFDPTLDVGQMIDNTNKLSHNKKVDNSFAIEKTAIKKRKITSFKLNSLIELRILDFDPKNYSDILPYELGDKKGIFIETHDGHKIFERNKS